MLTYSLAHWMAFLSTAILLNLSPGPDMAFILGQTARHGRRGGIAAMFGVWSGAALHVAMAALGLSAVLATSALAFSLVKWIGAATWCGWGCRSCCAEEPGKLPASPCRAHHARVPFSVRACWCRRSTPRWRCSSWPFCPVRGAGAGRPPCSWPCTAADHPGGGTDRATAGVHRRPTGACLSDHRRLGTWLEKALGGLFVTLGVKLALSER